MTIKEDLKAMDERVDMERTDEIVTTNMFIAETTLRRIISDYIYRRPEYKGQMIWESNFSPLRIVVDLEETPHTQESLGYELVGRKI